MGKLREQLHEETIKLDMTNWIKERNSKPITLKMQYDQANEGVKPEVNPL